MKYVTVIYKSVAQKLVKSVFKKYKRQEFCDTIQLLITWLARIATQFLTAPMLCVLILSTYSGTYTSKSTPYDRFLRNFSSAIFIVSEVLLDVYWAEIP